MASSAQQTADPCVLVIFGATGDLTKRKLMPAFYNLARGGLLPDNLAILAFARRVHTTENFRRELTEAMQRFGPRPLDTGLWEKIVGRVTYHTGDYGDPAAYENIRQLLEQADGAHGTRGNYLFYLATPPEVFAEVARQLSGAGLARSTQPFQGWRRLVVEKPFGHDLASARALNGELQAAFDESQIFRIDHYLGKETVQNVLVFRFANGIFEPIWNRRYIDHVQITAAESVGVEGRGGYYDSAGALRDMIQNHLFQLLALVAMEPPISFAGDVIRDQKVRVLQAIKPMEDEEIIRRSVRGQYGPGAIDGTPVPGYREEPSVGRDSTTETFAALKLNVENWRWADVPFYLRAGKRMARRETQIVIQFRRAPVLLFRDAGAANLEPNRLILHIQPDERIEVQFQAKRRGTLVQVAPAEMNFCYADLGESVLSTGYETLLYDVMTGDATLFHRADMVDAAWRVATPILDVWGALPPRDFPNYSSGSWGPTGADRLLERDKRGWHNPERGPSPCGP
ncbi:MAG: glucose-6-phosphate dehydrogenase [Candidatus Binatia bacterium]